MLSIPLNFPWSSQKLLQLYLPSTHVKGRRLLLTQDFSVGSNDGQRVLGVAHLAGARRVVCRVALLADERVKVLVRCRTGSWSNSF